MNRRQVLIGTGATAVAFGGFVPWANAAPPASVTFEPFTLGIRGSYVLRGSATLRGSIAAIVSASGGTAPKPVAAQSAIVSAPAVAAPIAQSAPVAAPPAQPMMSIVAVPREGRSGRSLN